jgi:hypothetical protein
VQGKQDAESRRRQSGCVATPTLFLLVLDLGVHFRAVRLHRLVLLLQLLNQGALQNDESVER